MKLKIEIFQLSVGRSLAGMMAVAWCESAVTSAMTMYPLTTLMALWTVAAEAAASVAMTWSLLNLVVAETHRLAKAVVCCQCRRIREFHREKLLVAAVVVLAHVPDLA